MANVGFKDNIIEVYIRHILKTYEKKIKIKPGKTKYTIKNIYTFKTIVVFKKNNIQFYK